MVCVGQAGNQIGASTARRTGPLSHLDLAAEALAEQEARTRRTKPSGFVFVDSEPKVVRTIVSEGSDSYLPFVSLNGSVVWDHNGRGNNWAWGYTGLASHRPGAAAAAAGGGAVKSPLGSERGQPLWQRALAAIHDQVRACGQRCCGMDGRGRIDVGRIRFGSFCCAPRIVNAVHRPALPLLLWSAHWAAPFCTRWRLLLLLRLRLLLPPELLCAPATLHLLLPLMPLCPLLPLSLPPSHRLSARLQAEACDLGMSSPSSSLLLVHSLGGGTGAGLGSRLLEACRDAFPK